MASITGRVPNEPELSGRPRSDPRGTLTLAADLQIIPDDQEGSPGSGQAGESAQSTAPLNPYASRARTHNLRRHLAAGDAAALSLAWGAEVLTQTGGLVEQQAVCGTVAVLVTLVAMHSAGLYRSRVCALRSLEAVRVITSSVVGTGAFMACYLIVGPIDVSRPIAAGAIGAAGVLALRWRFNLWLKARRSASNFLRTVVMVGTTEDADGLWTLLGEEPELGYRIGGIVGPHRPGSPWEDLPHCAGTDRVAELAAQAGANGIIVVASALSASERSTVMNQALAAGLHVQVWLGAFGFSSRRIRMAPVSGVPLMYVEPKRAAKWRLVVKRAMDLGLGTLFCLVAAPVVGAAALAIKLSDGSPVLHRSKRMGRDGTTIDVLKLRTMVPDAATMMVKVSALNERTGGPLFKASADPRVTKLGRFLRATSIDEIPQLWNVLNGTMSLVGPRPALVHEVEHFDADLRRRHEMRPGITGLWQVEARDNPSFSAYRRLDLSYVDDWSLGLDVAILASTAHGLVVRPLHALTRRVARHPSPSATAATAPAHHVAQDELARREPA
jgi:exopolysaccharide biosynthesis polyprenyl glycosylphosphotransferase